MKVILAYIVVVLIWSTTPLGIKWSNESLSFTAAVALRMAIAAILCWVILLSLRLKIYEKKRDLHAYLAGCIGLFPNMLLVYWSAQYIPSGLIALILGVYPFLVGLFSILILKENPFNAVRVIALTIALVGLGLIHYSQLQLGAQELLGVLGILLSSVLFAYGTVWLKKVGGGIHPLRQLTGTLTIAAPCFVISWWLMDGTIPEAMHWKSAFGVGYLVLAGSLLGGLTFFYVLKHCSVGSVSLITLMTPMMALVMGYLIENEHISMLSILGAALILVSLALYQGLFKIYCYWAGRQLIRSNIFRPSMVYPTEGRLR
jgi:probable blue pigment (indigoidine) exporter